MAIPAIPKQKQNFKNGSLIHIIILWTCVISLCFYENTVAKGKQYNQCNEQSAHSRVYIISINKSKIVF